MLHIPFIKATLVMSLACGLLVILKGCSSSRQPLSHRGLWSVLVAEHDIVRPTRFGPPVPSHKHNMPNIVLWSVVPLPPRSIVRTGY